MRWRIATIRGVRREPGDLLKPLKSAVRAAFDLLDGELERAGAAAEHDVKTIYISYMVGSEMVAAAYPQSKEVEVALALAEDHESSLLSDAGHLTWRTMPVSVTVRTEAEAEAVLPLVREAVERVSTGTHDVHRDNDYFEARRRRGVRRT